MGRRGVALLVCAMTLGVCATTARAATLTLEDVSDSNWTRTVVLRYQAAPGERNDVVFSEVSPGVVSVIERGNARLRYVPGVAAGACDVALDGKQATCTGLTAAVNEAVLVQPGSIYSVKADLGDGNDRVEAHDVYLSATGGDGDDTFVNLSGPPYPYSVVDGGPGDDTFSGVAVD